MALFNDNFYTQDFDQEMLDWIGFNHTRHISTIEGEWDAEGTKLEYYREFNYFWTSNAPGDTEELTKEQFKEKIGMSSCKMPRHSIEQETWRQYKYEDGYEINITEPAYLFISDSGTHRILDKVGVTHYIPQGWRELKWKEPNGATF